MREIVKWVLIGMLVLAGCVAAIELVVVRQLETPDARTLTRVASGAIAYWVTRPAFGIAWDEWRWQRRSRR